MSKPIAKITVVCPHCGSQQQEPEQAKSTFCRRCSEYFAIVPSTLTGAAAAALPTPDASFHAEDASSSAAPASSHGFGFKDKWDQLLGKPRTRIVQCFECSATHEASSSAQSSTCRACGAYVDLQDYKITGSFSRNIVTRGSVHLTSKGDLSSSRIVCDTAYLYGKMRGNLRCLGKVTVKLQGRIPGTLEAGHLVIEKGSDIVASRPIRVAQAEIWGKLSGHIISGSHVTVLKSGFLEGAVTAKCFDVERGGCFQGELTISPHELLTEEPADAPAENEVGQPVEQLETASIMDGEQEAMPD